MVETGLFTLGASGQLSILCKIGYNNNLKNDGGILWLR